MATWNTAFEASPANGDAPSEGAGKIREVKVEVGDRAEKEHTWGGAVAADGVHKAGSAKVYFTTATPTVQPDNATALGTGDKGRLYFKSSTGSALLVHNGTAFTSTGVTLSTSQTIYGVKTFKSVAVLSGGIRFDAANKLKTLILSLGDWNMDTDSIVRKSSALITATVLSNMVDCRVSIRPDVDASPRRYSMFGENGYADSMTLSIAPSGNGVLTLQRYAGGTYDNTRFNATSFNRGWVLITYRG